MSSKPPATAISRLPSPPVLPDEVLCEIFVKLPVKILLQLKRVCKSWKTLISDPHFARYQFQFHISIMAHERLAFFVDGNRSQVVTCPVQSLIETPSTPAETVEFRMTLERDYEIISWCNGLLCLYDNNCRFRLWNPCTRLKSKKSPEPQAQGTRGEMIKQCGFGYDKVNDKYKVIALFHVVEARVKKGLQVKTVAKVYTFGESSWTVIHEDLQCVLNSWDKYGQFASGNLHWLTATVTDQCKPILTIDVENETCGQLLLPPQLGGDVSLHGSGDCLYVCQMYHTHWDLWLMKDYGVQESWIKFVTIPLGVSPVTSCALLFFPLYIVENGVVLMRTTCSHSHLVIRYDSNDGSFSRCKISRDQHGKNARVYHESLVPPP